MRTMHATNAIELSRIQLKIYRERERERDTLTLTLPQGAQAAAAAATLLVLSLCVLHEAKKQLAPSANWHYGESANCFNFRLAFGKAL